MNFVLHKYPVVMASVTPYRLILKIFCQKERNSVDFIVRSFWNVWQKLISDFFWNECDSDTDSISFFLHETPSVKSTHQLTP